MAVERLADLTVLAGGLILVITVHADLPVAWSHALGPLEGALLVGGYFLVMAVAPLLRNWLQTTRRSDHPVVKRIIMTLDGLSQGAHPRTSVQALMLSIAIWAVMAFGYYLALVSMFPDFHWSATLLVLCAVNLTAIVWISPGNIGVYEAVAVLALSAYDVPADAALVAAVGLHAVVLGTTVLVGFVAKGMHVKQGGLWSDLV